MVSSSEVWMIAFISCIAWCFISIIIYWCSLVVTHLIEEYQITRELERRGIDPDDQMHREIQRRRYNGRIRAAARGTHRRRRRSSETTSSVWARREKAIMSKMHGITFKQAKEMNLTSNNNDIAATLVVPLPPREQINVNIDKIVSEGKMNDNANAMAVECSNNVEKARSKCKDKKNVTYSYDISNIEGCNCTICLCEFEDDDDMQFLPCGHYFHNDCIQQWFLDRTNVKIHCPVCLQSVFAAKKLKIRNSNNNNNDNNSGDNVITITPPKYELKVDLYNNNNMELETQLKGFDTVDMGNESMDNVTPLATNEFDDTTEAQILISARYNNKKTKITSSGSNSGDDIVINSVISIDDDESADISTQSRVATRDKNDGTDNMENGKFSNSLLGVPTHTSVDMAMINDTNDETEIGNIGKHGQLRLKSKSRSKSMSEAIVSIKDEIDELIKPISETIEQNAKSTASTVVKIATNISKYSSKHNSNVNSHNNSAEYQVIATEAKLINQ